MGRSNMDKTDRFTGTAAEPNASSPQTAYCNERGGSNPDSARPDASNEANRESASERAVRTLSNQETPADEESRRERKTPQKGHAEEVHQKERDLRDRSTCGGFQGERTQGPKEEAEPQGPEWRNPGTQDQTDPPERRRTRQEEKDPENPKERRHPEGHEPRQKEWQRSGSGTRGSGGRHQRPRNHPSGRGVIGDHK